MTEALIGFAAVLFLIFMRVPIAFAMGVVGVAGYANETNANAALSMASRLIADAARDYGLSVVPLFILMGLFVNQAGLSREIYRCAHAFIGHLRGGLAMATIAACGLFAAISGSSLATASTMSRVAMPEMRKYGYADSLSTASIAAGGTLGILIPPSIVLVVYGLLTQTSIHKLFLAGILPGILGILFYMITCAIIVYVKPEEGPRGDKSTWSHRIATLRDIGGVLLLFVMVIGGLYGVFDFAPLNLTFSPTEAAGMGAFGAFLIGLFRKRLNLRNIMAALKETAITTTGLFAILIGAWIFSNFINYVGMPDALLALISGYDLSPMTVILAIVLIYILLGCVFESLSMMVLTVPVFFPLVTSLGFDPIWFGIVVVVVTEISLITPPVGLNVFIMKSVVPDVTTGTIFRGVTAFWIADIVRLAVIIALPIVALFLPSLI